MTEGPASGRKIPSWIYLMIGVDVLVIVVILLVIVF